jgi:hypothetical protein
VGRSELRAATSPLIGAMQHKLYLLGWPGNLSARHWQAEIGGWDCSSSKPAWPAIPATPLV